MANETTQPLICSVCGPWEWSGAVIDKKAPDGTRSPNGRPWAHETNGFYRVSVQPRVDRPLVWSISMIAEFRQKKGPVVGQFILDVRDANKVRPQRPWPLLEIPDNIKCEQKLGVEDEGCEACFNHRWPEKPLSRRLRSTIDGSNSVAPSSHVPVADWSVCSDLNKSLESIFKQHLHKSLELGDDKHEGRDFEKVHTVPDAEGEIQTARFECDNEEGDTPMKDYMEDPDPKDECLHTQRKALESQKEFPGAEAELSEKHDVFPNAQEEQDGMEDLVVSDGTGKERLERRAMEREEPCKGDEAINHDFEPLKHPELVAPAALKEADPGPAEAHDEHGSDRAESPKDSVDRKLSYITETIAGTTLPPKLEEFLPPEFMPDTLIVFDSDECSFGNQGSRAANTEPPISSDPPAAYTYERVFLQPGDARNKEAPRIAELHLSASQLYGRGSHSSVYRAILKPPPPLTANARSKDGTVTVIAKTAFSDRNDRSYLRNEARILSKLSREKNAHLQQGWCGYNAINGLHSPVPLGPVVPKFYGFYDPEDSKQGKLSPIILMEDCGRPVDPDVLASNMRQASPVPTVAEHR